MATAEAVPRERAGKRQRAIQAEKSIKFPGDNGEGEPPVPIPNTAVKPLSANGTCRETGWESRSLPGIIFKTRMNNPGFYMLKARILGSGFLFCWIIYFVSLDQLK